MPFTTSLLALKFYKFVCFSVQKLTRETLQKKDNLISSEKKWCSRRRFCCFFNVWNWREKDSVREREEKNARKAKVFLTLSNTFQAPKLGQIDGVAHSLFV